MLESGFGGLLRRYRVAAGLTQEELADRAGISARGISDLERGAHGLPRQDTLRLLLDALALAPPDRAKLVAAARRPATTRARRERVDRQSGLPVPLTPLIGREQAIEHVAALLVQPTIRLLTLTGAGGVGKTRLALAVAEQVAPRFPDGVVFVSLAPLADPALVAPAIAERLGVREPAAQTLAHALATYLAGKRLLLILDNCEHLLPAAPFISELLGACPALRVLTTSRAALHLTGEHLYPVSPLALPDPVPPPLEELADVAAVRLFVERVRAVKPDFALSESNAPAAVEIVRRLDGLPLALELVAARARFFSPAALLARLDPSLPLLTGGASDLPHRQRTLRGTIAWSYDLLRPHEQALFRRLGVFAGGWSQEAAETVAELEWSVNTLDGLVALLDGSLVQIEDRGGESRYTMLATIREFALERLNENGEEVVIRNRHAEFFLDLLEQRDPEYADPAWLGDIDREHDNLRAALTWSRESHNHDTLLRLTGALALFWYYRGYLMEGRRWLDQALQTPPDGAMPRPRAWVLTQSGMLANISGESDLAATRLAESLTWWKQSGDAYGYMMGRSLLGGVRVSQGNYDEAAALFAANAAYFRDNEAYLREAGHDEWIAHARFHLGLIAWVQGDEACARGLLREAVEIWDRGTSPVDVVDPLRYLGLLACGVGDLDEAATWFREEWARLRKYGTRAAFAVGLADVATLAAAREAWQPAVRLFAKAESLAQTEAAAFSLPARDHYERAHHLAQAALGAAAPAETAAGRALTLEQALAEAEAVLEWDHDGEAREDLLTDSA